MFGTLETIPNKAYICAIEFRKALIGRYIYPKNRQFVVI